MIHQPPGYTAIVSGCDKFRFRVNATKLDADKKYYFIYGPAYSSESEAIAEWNSIFGKGVA